VSEAARCRCPVCTADAALLLVETGRPGMALPLLRGLPGAIWAAIDATYHRGRADARRRQRPVTGAPPPPAQPPRPARCPRGSQGKD
jgi:hypothetical protein